jgi:EAL domain-containing protein (putative c-di-GMP-specific phosphodiesterase class I)/ActR/RegA family two-component response regulator
MIEKREAAENVRLKGRVLVVDDDAVVRGICKRVLGAAGFDIELAIDGASAIELIATGFDVILSDIQMPGMDGVQLLRKVRERDLDVPVILMTGSPTIETAMHAIELGALRYVPKPFIAAEMISIVTDAIRLGRLARMKREALELLGSEAKLVGDRAGLEATFARALDSLWMAFQPIVLLAERRVYGHEALMRSMEPTLPHPGAVLEAAERLDQIHALGRVVRDRVAETIRSSNQEVAFFVNLHSHDLLDESLMSPESPLSRVANRVVLEITERASLDKLEDVRGRITALRDLGFRLAVDDLGAGYAGLTTFASIEPDIVKIDMSLIRDIDKNPVKRKIVDKMTELAHALEILVVAEGIETVGERDVVAELGCDFLQGYLFAKPGKPFPEVNW